MEQLLGLYYAGGLAIVVGLAYLWHDHWYMPRQNKKKLQKH